MPRARKSSGGPPRRPGRGLDPGAVLAGAAGAAPLPPGHRSGFVAIIGRPNVGKSTLLNRILGQRLAIVTRKPGTTRRRLLGVLTRPEGQIAFFDTPGLERPRTRLGRFLLEAVKAACAGADLVLFLTEGRDEEADRHALGLIEAARAPVFLGINKVDLLKGKERLLPLLERYAGAGRFEEMFPLSALKGDNVEALVAAILRRLPEGPRYFPPGAITDASERTLVEEFVREQVYRQLHREVPYAAAVRVVAMERDPRSDLLHVEAEIYVERKSQRGILVGKGGSRIKALGQASRAAIEARLGEPIFLGLKVRIKANWRQREGDLRDLGYENA